MALFGMKAFQRNFEGIPFLWFAHVMVRLE
jgi:hypothetical protein